MGNTRPRGDCLARRVHVRRLGAVAVGLLVSVACGQRAVAVEFRSGGYAFSSEERNEIEAIADRAALDVRQLLPTLPDKLTLRVQTGDRVIPETGETGEVGVPIDRAAGEPTEGGVYWTVDPKHNGGVLGVARSQLRATLFHEFYHLVREAAISPRSLRDRAIDEGLATAFERDFGGAPTPWGAYPRDIAEWTKEFLSLPHDAPRDQWMSRHPDGRRWIGYKVGTYLADRAVRASGRSLSELAPVPTETIVEWAQRE